MKKFPSIFTKDFEDNMTVVYTGDSFNATPWFSAVSVETLLGVKNPYGTVSNRVNNVINRIHEYSAAHPTEEHIADGTKVVLLGSVKPAKMVADDGQYAVLAVMSSNKVTAKPSYYYNEAVLFYVLNTSRTEVANELQHWVNSTVLPTIRRTGEFNLHRKDGIGLRRVLTDTIKDGIENKELTDGAYMTVTEAVYYIRFGFRSQTLRDVLGIGNSESIREHLNQEDLDALGAIEGHIAGALTCGMKLEDVVNNPRLIKRYRRSLKI